MKKTLVILLLLMYAVMSVTHAETSVQYRALIIGEYSYDDGRNRTGGLNTATGVSEMLSKQAVENGYEVTLKLDTSRQELITSIHDAFSDADADDISVFYINCHGEYDGVSYIQLHDGTKVTATQLEQMLSEINGKIVVIIDCCSSGAFIGKAEQVDTFTSSVVASFTDEMSGLRSDKYLVLTSAAGKEDSFRRSFTGENDEQGMATIFARSLCEGAGWDIINDRVCSFKADSNKDKQITFNEIYRYTVRRVLYYLKDTGKTQTVCTNNPGDGTVLFARSAG